MKAAAACIKESHVRRMPIATEVAPLLSYQPLIFFLVHPTTKVNCTQRAIFYCTGDCD